MAPPPAPRAAMRVLHATDVRQIPLIVRHGLFASARRSACVPDTPAGRAYVGRIIAEQGRRGWPMAALVFAVGEGEVAPADDPYGVGLALTRPGPEPPPQLLARLETIDPQGHRIAGAFRQWRRDQALCWLDPARLDRTATAACNEGLREDGLLLAGQLDAVRRALAARGASRVLPAAALGLLGVVGIGAALLLTGRHGPPPAAGTRGLYAQHCAGCHGATGRGDGLEARLTFLKMMNFTDAKAMAVLSDEYLYTVIAKGSAALGGTSAMPGWDRLLTPDEVRALVAYIRTFAARPAPSR